MLDLLIFPNTLIEDNLILKSYVISNIYIIEHPVYFTMYKYHKLKLILHRSTMKYYENYLITKYKISKNKIKYINFNLFNNFKFDNVIFYDPCDHYVIKDIHKKCNNYTIIHNPIFLTKKSELKFYWNNYSRNHKSFYIWQRRKLNILIDKNKKPLFDKWSFDIHNRNPFPKNITNKFNNEYLKTQYNKNKKNIYVIEAIKYVSNNFHNNPGNYNFYLPITFKDVKLFYDYFILEKLNNFGIYEDAVNTNINFGFHSVISPLINIGLITPNYIINIIKNIPVNIKSINSIEGYIRQIIGWREYCYLFYLFGRKTFNKNIFNNTNKLNTDIWYNKTKLTNISIIDKLIEKTINIGYLHHIERLMYIGNFMLITQINPKDVFKWFQTMFLDSYHVFMYPNVYGMSQYSCGNFMMSRPYFSSSNYLIKMSNFNKKEQININNKYIYTKDLWNYLYYSFINKNKKILYKNYATYNMVKHWLNKPIKEKNIINKYSKIYLINYT